MEFLKDLIFSTFFGLRKTRFEQSCFAQIFDLIAFLRRSETISIGLPFRNSRTRSSARHVKIQPSLASKKKCNLVPKS